MAFVTVVPSPYQRDLFHALSRRPELSLEVFYLEASTPDSPWPRANLEENEAVLPGFCLSARGIRCHINWALPDISRYDLVVLNTMMSATGQWLARHCTKKGVPWIFYGERLRDRAPGWRTSIRDAWFAPVRRAAAIAAIGTVASADYARRFPHVRRFCVPYYTDLRPFMESPSRTAGTELVFLFCGQMIRRKGVDVLLDAFSRLVDSSPGTSLRLLLVGREADLAEMLAPLSPLARSRVTYEGFQDPKRLPDYFARADVFVLPSRYDGWGVVVNQALGAGLPIICSTTVGAAHDLVEDEVNGLKTAPGDAPMLAEAMARFVHQRDLAPRWGAASRAKAEDWLPERGAAKWVEAIATVLDRA